MAVRPALTVLVMDDCPTAEILLAGDLDATADSALAEVVAGILIDPQVLRIEVDVAGLAYADACGVAALFRVQQRAANFGVRLRLVRVRPPLHRILDCAEVWRSLADPEQG
ncbi:STAS domain-containing protein [Streptacidiphilus carbonis]|uniref:STAS domain-containing protein n=1 Tax=Streptacidiphilus carbonis TaxID=105422 RepID=UPI0005A750C1|nr:STAS domain-containing protein [Streptacidiphilus carbonis]